MEIVRSSFSESSFMLLPSSATSSCDVPWYFASKSSSAILLEISDSSRMIQGYAEGLQENISDDAESREFYCDVIIDEAQKMNQIFSSSSSGIRSPVLYTAARITSPLCTSFTSIIFAPLSTRRRK